MEAKTPYPIREIDVETALRKNYAHTALCQYTQGLFMRTPRLTTSEINRKIAEATQLYKEACTEIETTVEAQMSKAQEPVALSNENYSPRLTKG